MKEKLIARSYAQALLELGRTESVDVVGELTKLTETINGSNELENVLFLEVFTIGEKQLVLSDILERLEVSSLVKNFFSFLCQEKRLSLFPLIFKEIVVIDDDNKGFIRGVVQGHSEQVDQGNLDKLSRYMEKFLGKKIRLQYEQNSEVISGHRVHMGSVQLDVTINNQLEQFKKTVLQGEVL